jgi:hypothetical protein
MTITTSKGGCQLIPASTTSINTSCTPFPPLLLTKRHQPAEKVSVADLSPPKPPAAVDARDLDKVGKAAASAEKSYPLEFPAYGLLSLSTVVAIAFVGSIFEVTGPSPVVSIVHVFMHTFMHTFGTCRVPRHFRVHKLHVAIRDCREAAPRGYDCAHGRHPGASARCMTPAAGFVAPGATRRSPTAPSAAATTAAAALCACAPFSLGTCPHTRYWR